MPEAVGEIASDLCRGLMLPADWPTYEKVSPTKACSEMLGILSMVSPHFQIVYFKFFPLFVFKL